MGGIGGAVMKKLVEKLEHLLELGGTKKDIALLAITGVLGPVVGALVHNAGSVLVIINSALLLGYKRKKTKKI